MSWGVGNLPYGVFSCPGERPRVGVRYGDRVLDLAPALHDEIARRVRALEAGALEEAAVEALVREAYELAGALPS